MWYNFEKIGGNMLNIKAAYVYKNKNENSCKNYPIFSLTNDAFNKEILSVYKKQINESRVPAIQELYEELNSIVSSEALKQYRNFVDNTILRDTDFSIQEGSSIEIKINDVPFKSTDSIQSAIEKGEARIITLIENLQLADLIKKYLDERNMNYMDGLFMISNSAIFEVW